MIKKTFDPAEIRHVILDVNGATCSGCAYTIEHVGGKFPGIADVQVDRINSEIHLDCDGKPETIQQIVDLVSRIGYSASPRVAGA